MKYKYKYNIIIIMIIFSLLLGGCTDGEIRKIYKEQNMEIEALKEELRILKSEKADLEEKLEVFIEIEEVDSKKFIELKDMAKNYLQGENLDLTNYNTTSLLKNKIQSLPQNLVFEDPIIEDDIQMEYASNNKNLDELIVGVASYIDSEDLKGVVVRGSIKGNVQAKDSLYVMDQILEELFPGSEEAENLLVDYIEDIENRIYRKEVELGSRSIELKTSKDSRDSLYGFIEMNILY